MIVQMFDPDREYARLLDDPDKSKAVRFLSQEAACFISIKSMIDSCRDDADYERLLPTMVEVSGHIRSSIFKSLKHQYGILEWRKKRYLNKLFKSLEF